MTTVAKTSRQSLGWTLFTVLTIMVHQYMLYKNIHLNQRTMIMNMNHFWSNLKRISIQEIG
eukprot:7873206-Prorocentrum_lima.AAC.1